MPRPIIDLTNQRFNRLLVLHRDMDRPHGSGKAAYWLCKCDCGNIVSVRSDKLRKNIISSCGCYSKEVHSQLFSIDMTGQKIGKLTVLYRDNSKPQGKNNLAYWICQCECGNIVSVRGTHLREGKTLSCGCINSAGELLISKLLQQNNIDYKIQYEFKDLKGDYNNLRFDFAIFSNKKLQCLIEYQGKQHYEPHGFDTEERFAKRLEYDKLKVNYCKEKGIKLVIIPYTEYKTLNWNRLQELIGGDSNE